MFKYIISSISQLKSFILLVSSNCILALLLSFNEFSKTYSSTGFSSNYSLLFTIKNYIVDFFFQLFGVSIYILPIVLLIWSYKVFFNHKISTPLLKLIALLIVLLLSPLLVSNFIGQNYGGILGAYLGYLLHNYQIIFYIIAVFCILSLLFTLSVTINNLFISFKLINFVLKSIALYAYNKYYYLRYKTSGLNYNLINKIKKNTSKPENKDLSSILKHLDNQDINKSQQSDDSLALDSVWKKIKGNLHHKKDKNINDKDINEDIFIQESNNSIDIKNTAKPLEEEKKTNHTLEIPKNIDVDYDNYNIPTTFLDSKVEKDVTSSKEIKEIAIKLENVIKEFGIEGKIVNIQPGPVVTLYEISIPPGVKTSKIIGLDADISLRMKAVSVRIAIVPGKDVIGIEIPNTKRQTVYLRKLLEDQSFTSSNMALPMNLGLDISGKPIVADLATMPHLLIAGTTGSGKSVAVNAMILSLLYKLNPDQCKMIMIDPKMLELSIYQDIPHLLTPVVTDPKKAIFALKWAVKQMEHRYSLMSALGVRNISSYNEKILDTESVEDTKERYRITNGEDIELPHMPYIVVIIDEMADLMMVAGKEIEAAVQRLAQMARAAGIHVIMATQRPSVDVITGTIKANFPSRISFQVSSKIDSRTILGDQGAERLLGKGDMLYMMGAGRIKRIHGPFVSDSEVDKVVSILHKMGSPSYIEDVIKEENEDGASSNSESELDSLYNEVIELIKTEGKISTSFIQRRFQIGYNRAARIMDSLEQNGVIGKPSATGKREILINF